MSSSPGGTVNPDFPFRAGDLWMYKNGDYYSFTLVLRKDPDPLCDGWYTLDQTIDGDEVHDVTVEWEGRMQIENESHRWSLIGRLDED